MECFRPCFVPVLVTALIVIGVHFGASVHIPKQWIPLLRDLCIAAQDRQYTLNVFDVDIPVQDLKVYTILFIVQVYRTKACV